MKRPMIQNAARLTLIALTTLLIAQSAEAARRTAGKGARRAATRRAANRTPRKRQTTRRKTVRPHRNVVGKNSHSNRAGKTRGALRFGSNHPNGGYFFKGSKGVVNSTAKSGAIQVGVRPSKRLVPAVQKIRRSFWMSLLVPAVQKYGAQSKSISVGGNQNKLLLPAVQKVRPQREGNSLLLPAIQKVKPASGSSKSR